MKKNNSKVAAMIKAIAGKMASVGCNSASEWGFHQPKAPKALGTPKKMN